MDIVIWVFTLITTFMITEFTAWFNHKYIMHGPLWVLHKDHHKKDHKSWFERNDLFFFFYAFLSASFVVMWGQGFWLGLPIAIGIGAIVRSRPEVKGPGDHPGCESLAVRSSLRSPAGSRASSKAVIALGTRKM